MNQQQRDELAELFYRSLHLEREAVRAAEQRPIDIYALQVAIDNAHTAQREFWAVLYGIHVENR